MDPEQEAKGIDTILEFAIEVLNRAAEDKDKPTETNMRQYLPR